MIRRFLILTLISCLCSLSAFSQKAADRVIGNYYAKLSKNDMKVKVFKYQDGYRMQIYWLKNTRNADGSLKVDKNNPDKSKRNTPMTSVTLVDKVKYNQADGIWEGGRIYEPTHGKTYKVELRLKDNTLEVRGKLGPFHKSMYWKRCQ